jgi:hypothetical protein
VTRQVYGVCAYLGGALLHCAPDVLLPSSQLPVVISVAWGRCGRNGGVVVANKPRKEEQNSVISKKNNKRRKINLLVMF